MLNCLNRCSYSYVEGANRTQPEIGMSTFTEEGPTCFSKSSSKKKHIPNKAQLTNTLLTGLTQN